MYGESHILAKNKINNPVQFSVVDRPKSLRGAPYLYCADVMIFELANILE